MRCFSLAALALTAVALTGCSASFAPTVGVDSSASTPRATITGSIFGGRQPIVGAKVFLFENGILGDAGPGIPASSANQSVSLLCRAGVTCGTGTALDPTLNAYYVLTNATGGFSISNDYTCDAGRQVYLYAVGGMPDGQTENDSAANMVSLGTCPGAGVFPSSLRLYMNEVSTVALAYAVAGYASDATHISHSGSTLATTGINNAFANVTQLYDISDPVNGTDAATARATTPNGQGTVPQLLLNSLANTLAACVNSGGSASAQCSTLFADTTANSVVPTDTASAAINIAHSPGTNVADLYNLPAATGYPFGMGLGATAPNDFTVAINFAEIPTADAGSAQPPVVDAGGNVWLVNSTSGRTADANGNTGSLLRYSPLGDVTEFTNDILTPTWLAFSNSNTGWVINQDATAGTIVLGPDQPTPTVIAADFNDPLYMAFDKYNHAWVAPQQPPATNEYELSVYDSTGAPVGASPYIFSDLRIYASPTPDHAGHINAYGLDPSFAPQISQISYDGTGIHEAIIPLDTTTYSYFFSLPPIADHNDHLWLYGADTNFNLFLQEFSNAGALLHSYPAPAALTAVLPPTLDGAGVFWNADGTHLVAQNSSGVVLSPANGYQYDSTGAIGNGFSAIDGSGDVWVLKIDYNSNQNFMSELIGAATPVITPISANNPADGTTGLGVRP